MPREVQVSKKMSWLLRHGAEKEGLHLGEGGYISVKDVVSPYFFAMAIRIFYKIIATCESNLHPLSPPSYPLLSHLLPNFP